MRIGPYEVVATLGEGSMGVVYGARSPMGAEVAIKVLRKNDAEVIVRFERERRLLASLGESDGFVPLIDAGATATAAYLVMPLVPGGTLRRKLEAGPLEVEAAVELGRRLALALGAAHARGIVHRDLKPENVLFTRAGDPLVTDLGLAKHFDPDVAGASQSVSLSRTGALLGTAGYMAPEQMRDSKNVGPPADVFALGAILYECLSGEPPFLGEGLVDVCERVMAGRWVPLRERRASIPAWLDAVVTRTLAQAPGARFEDGLALGEALAAGEVGAAPPPRPSRAILVGAGLVLLGGALGVAFVLAPREPTPAAQPPSPGQPVVAKPASGGVADADLTPDVAPDDLYDYAPTGEKKPWEAKIAECTRMIERNPKIAAAWYNRSVYRAQANDQDGVIADCTRAIELAPKLAVAWAGRATARGLEGDADGMIADCTRAIELDPLLAKAWHNRASGRATKGDLGGSLADDTRAIELDPTLASAWLNRGIVKARQEDRDGAIADLTRAVELAPKKALAWFNRGINRAHKGDWDGAIADCTRAIELDPKSERPWRNRGVCRSTKGDYGGAISDLKQFLVLAPGDPEAGKIRGEIARLQGLLDKRSKRAP
jgi:tetratricopeptide (TPR) repeat protein